MKTVLDYITAIEEDAMAVNTSAGGAIALKQLPIGKVEKRKVPLDDVYAPTKEELDAANATTGEDASLARKKKFKQKESYQNDQVMSYA
jgi:hypothetical protein